MKKVIAMLLAVTMCMTSMVPVLAAEQGVATVEGQQTTDEALGIKQDRSALPTETVDETPTETGAVAPTEGTETMGETPTETEAVTPTEDQSSTTVQEGTMDTADEAVTAAVITPKEASVSTWKAESDGWRYYDSNGNYLTGLAQITVDGKTSTYYFNQDGYMQKGFLYVDHKRYFFNDVGTNPATDDLGKAAHSTWLKYDNTFYYFGDDGVVTVGWLKIDGYWRYFLDDGKMFANGWKQQDGYYRYFNEWGCMLTSQWMKIDGYYRYLNEWGCMLTNQWMKIDGYYRYLNEWGCMLTNQFMKIDGYYRYLNEWGCMMTGWQKLDGYWRWFNEWGCMMTGWQTLDGYRRYFNEWGCMMTGQQTIDGNTYSFNEWGCIVGGYWTHIDGYKYYVGSNGQISTDVRDKVSGPYMATVNRSTCTITIYAKEGGYYNTPVVAFACSVGKAGTPTPAGTFYTDAKYRWKELMGPSWGQYATHIVGGVYFHSVAGSNASSYNLSASEYNKLGRPASHGCIRLSVADAKWIYDNCSLGMKVMIGDELAQPFAQPATHKIPASQNWDPTDPNI